MPRPVGGNLRLLGLGGGGCDGAGSECEESCEGDHVDGFGVVGRQVVIYGRLMCCGKLLLGQSLVMYQTTLRGSSASYTRVQRIVRNLFP